MRRTGCQERPSRTSPLAPAPHIWPLQGSQVSSIQVARRCAVIEGREGCGLCTFCTPPPAPRPRGPGPAAPPACTRLRARSCAGGKRRNVRATAQWRRWWSRETARGGGAQLNGSASPACRRRRRCHILGRSPATRRAGHVPQPGCGGRLPGSRHLLGCRRPHGGLGLASRCRYHQADTNCDDGCGLGQRIAAAEEPHPDQHVRSQRAILQRCSRGALSSVATVLRGNCAAH